MSDFLQLHLLTVYGPSNLNRDDTGRPKGADFGGVRRLRVSSQSLKRAWRESDVFKDALFANMGRRTQRLGQTIVDHLAARNVPEKKAMTIARSIAGIFGKIKGDEDSAFIEQLAFVSPEEESAALAMAERALDDKKFEPKPEDLLRTTDTAVDIAMFGRMLADAARFNREAAVQVAHAITTHKAVAEDDYYTAVDDLKDKKNRDDAGAGFLGVQEFGAGVFYLYVCIDRGLLEANLGGNRPLRDAALRALGEAAAKVGPRGKQNSFASRAHASYVLAERGAQSPRSLIAAFLDPVKQGDQLGLSIGRLEKLLGDLDRAYGSSADARETLNVHTGQGSLDSIKQFMTA